MSESYPISSYIERTRTSWPENAGIESELVFSILRLHDLLRRGVDPVLVAHGLTVGGFEVLATLRSSPPALQMTPTELYRTLLVTSGGLTKTLKGLEEAGLVVRQQSEADKRSKFVQLTSAGKSKIESVMAEVNEVDRSILRKAMTKDQLGVLHDSLLESLRLLEEGRDLRD